MLLHGFPMFWWTWRHLVPHLAEHGYTAIAMDLRGYGGSDHTPHGYDPTTLASDVAGVIRSLGYSQAALVGHGWGGLVAWSTAVQRASCIRAVVPVGVPHPLRLREATQKNAEQRKLSRYALGYQWPFTPERALLRKDAAQVEELLRKWSGTPGWPDPRTALHYRRAMQFRSTAHCALEYYRWAIRSIPRNDGRRYVRSLQAPVTQPVLHVLGRSDGSILPTSSDGSEEYVTGRYERVDMAGVGHFPHEEDAKRFNQLLVPWLDEVHS